MWFVDKLGPLPRGNGAQQPPRAADQQTAPQQARPQAAAPPPKAQAAPPPKAQPAPPPSEPEKKKKKGWF